jgi:hypothetical protein
MKSFQLHGVISGVISAVLSSAILPQLECLLATPEYLLMECDELLEASFEPMEKNFLVVEPVLIAALLLPELFIELNLTPDPPADDFDDDLPTPPTLTLNLLAKSNDV